MGDLIIAEKSDFVMLADAIRAKTGTIDQISFVDGFINGINSIESGGAIETCVLTCNRDSSPAPDDIIIYYVDEMFQLRQYTVTETRSDITLIKGSMIYLNNFSRASQWSSTLTLIDDHLYAAAVFFVSDSGTLRVSLG